MWRLSVGEKKKKKGFICNKILLSHRLDLSSSVTLLPFLHHLSALAATADLFTSLVLFLWVCVGGGTRQKMEGFPSTIEKSSHPASAILFSLTRIRKEREVSEKTPQTYTKRDGWSDGERESQDSRGVERGDRKKPFPSSLPLSPRLSAIPRFPHAFFALSPTPL